eukprot:3290937-Alexandrium_andersonii.AAC.1
MLRVPPCIGGSLPDEGPKRLPQRACSVDAALCSVTELLRLVLVWAGHTSILCLLSRHRVWGGW